MSEVLTYLQSKGVPLKGAPGDEVHFACPFCREDPSSRGRFYINVGEDEATSGLYLCHICGAKGNYRTLRKFYGDPIETKEEEDHSWLRQRILASAADFYHSCLDEATLEYLHNVRGLSDETIKAHQLGWAPGGLKLYGHLRSQNFESKAIVATGLVRENNAGKFQDFFQQNITIPYHVQGGVVMIRGKEIGGKYLTPTGNKARLYNIDTIRGEEEVVVCEGEFDALVMEQLGYHTVGLPGAASWQQHWNPYVEDARKVFLVFDPDDAGLKGAEKVKAQLGAKAKPVDLPIIEGAEAKDIDPSYLVVEKQWGRLEFESLFLDVLARTSILITPAMARQEWEGLQGRPKFKLGFANLDRAIDGGMLDGQVAVVLAKTNVGKTIHLLNMLQRSSHEQPDAKYLFVSLEQTRGDWFERARRIWNFYNLDCPSDQVHAETELYWKDRIRLTDLNRMTEEQLLGAIDDFIEQVGAPPTMVAVDYLGYWAHGFTAADRYNKVTEAIMSLKAIAKDRRTKLWVPHQVNRGADFGTEPDVDSGRDSGAIEETADFVFTIWATDTMKGTGTESRSGIVQTRIGKSRHGGKGELIPMQFAPLTLTMVPHSDSNDTNDEATKNLVGFARNEITYSSDRMDWEDAIFCHRTGAKYARSTHGLNP